MHPLPPADSTAHPVRAVSNPGGQGPAVGPLSRHEDRGFFAPERFTMTLRAGP